MQSDSSPQEGDTEPTEVDEQSAAPVAGSAPVDPPNPAVRGGESTGADTSGPTGGAEPFVPDPTGSPERVELLEVPGGPALGRVVPAVVLGIVAAVLVVLLVRRRRS